MCIRIGIDTLTLTVSRGGRVRAVQQTRDRGHVYGLRVDEQNENNLQFARVCACRGIECKVSRACVCMCVCGVWVGGWVGGISIGNMLQLVGTAAFIFGLM